MNNIKIYNQLVLAVLLGTGIASGQSTDQNFVLSRTFKQTGAAVNDVSKVNIQVQYLDGLGRPMQTVSVGQSTAGTDLVIPIEYDADGRQPKNYLPYAVDNIANGNGKFQTGAAAAQAGFYDPSKAAVLGLESADMGRLYQETVFEASPAARTLSLQAPGNKSRSSNFIHGTNAASEVKLYRYAANADILQTISTNSSYEAAALYRVQTSDDQNNISVEFTDKAGRIVCKKVIASGTETLVTYYVYDDYGLLRAVLQPQYQEEANAGNFTFLYDYDERGRVITKYVPGAGRTDIVYNNFERPVLSQDAGQKVRGIWAFTKYDRVNRPVMTGEYTSASSRSDLQTALNASTAHHETTDGSTIGYTLNATLPAVAEADVLNVTYYDTYSFPGAQAYVNALAVSTNTAVKSQQTGGRTKMLVAGSAWLVSTVHYDAEYRPVQTVRQLHDLGAITTERVSIKYKYDLAAVVDQQKTDHESSAGAILNSLLKTFEYDHADRLLSVKEKVVIGSTKIKEATTLAQRYNVLGQLRSKWFHAYNADPTKYRRRTDYVNNTRGWVTTAKTWYQQTAGTDLAFYGLSLAYNNPLYAAQYSNGNISSMMWSGKDKTTFTKGLSFIYDGANRLKTSTGLGGYADSESGITYDLNGNIKTLTRAGNAVDILTYSYAGTGNRLGSITDASPSNKGLKSGTSSYVYDANGNMTSDGNRGAILTYNYLNLPKTVEVGGKTLIYDYDAGGNKHKYIADTLTVKYAGVFEYDANNVLKRVSTSEGQLVPSGDTLRFDYSLKDHLGNVRVVFDEKGNILQKSDYYPFGLSISRDGALPANARNGVNRYLFNGIERETETGIYQARFRGLDPLIGRWMQIDPKPDLSMSLYVAMNNNPIRYTDPMGDTTIVNNRGVVQKQYGGDNFIYQQGRKGKLTQIGEFGKSIDLSKILPNIMKDNKNAAKMMGAIGFANAVRPGGKWDYKDANAQKGNIFGALAKYEDATKNITSFTSGKLNFVEGGADLGNYNYGYTGRYVGGDGYSPITLWGAAGVLQTGKDFLQGKFGKTFTEFGSMVPMPRPPLGDEADDFIWTTTGMIHADNEKKSNN